MNLEELMAVWKSQDAVPLHGINETLVRQVLRQGEANMRIRRRLEKGITYLVSAFLVAVMAYILAVMINDDAVRTGWDYAIPIGGALAVLLWPGFLRVSLRAQARREQSFGESLRDQLNLQIAQLDFYLRRVDSPAFHLVNNLGLIGWVVAIYFAALRIKGKPVSDAWSDPRILFVSIISFLVCAIGVTFGSWLERRLVKWELLPRKRRLEALLKELDGQE